MIVRGRRSSLDLINDVRAYGDKEGNWKKMSEQSCFQDVLELNEHNEQYSTMFIPQWRMNDLATYPLNCDSRHTGLDLSLHAGLSQRPLPSKIGRGASWLADSFRDSGLLF